MNVIEMNKGKSFEHDFRESAVKQNLWIMRINDTYYNAKEYDPKAFVPKQACDYLIHKDGELYLLELKSTEKKYITIERDGTNGMIKQHQYEQLQKLNGEHEHGLLVLQFERDVDQKTFFMPIDGFISFLDAKGKKSINVLDCVQYGGYQIPQMKARVHWWYDVKKALF